MSRFFLITVTSFALLFSSVGATLAQSRNEDDVATLYRESVVIRRARIHVATFDADAKTAGGAGFDYNWSNCTTAAKLFEAQVGVTVSYWCEKGLHRK